MSTVSTKNIYDPVEFVTKIEILTIAVVASFITMKFLNSLYEYIYEPTIDLVIDNQETENYYIRIGSYYIQIGMIIKEFIKWLFLIILLMIIYNLVTRNKK